jgi:hypothetical protein
MKPTRGPVQSAKTSSKQSTTTVAYVASAGKKYFFLKKKSFRTQDINDGLRAVQWSIAYDRKDSQAGTCVTVSRAEPMGTDDLMEQMCNHNYEYSQMAKNEKSCHPEEPDTGYLLEHNVRQNFGFEEQSSAKWYKYSENSQRPY